ncbi:MAG: SymE family type I addiction module toxin [Steroidobacteraceae bacterium]
MNARRLTVSRHYPERRASRSGPTLPMPFLRLQGRWLDQAGFTIGANVQIAVSRGRLIVEVIESAPQQQQQEQR